MSTIELVGLLAVFIGIAGGTALLVSRPRLWLSFGLEFFKMVLPYLKGIETPEQLRDRTREGRERGGKDR